MEAQHAATVRRACNYFTLAELLHYSPAAVSEGWAVLTAKLDLTQPLPLALGAVLGRLDLDPPLVQRAYHRVAAAMRTLGADDHVVALGDASYPPRLAPVAGAPPFLFVRGDLELLQRPAIAVVGTRHPTPDGRLRARKLGYLLAKRGIVVASGLALGIDEAAHLGVLDIGGDPVAVLGTPLNRTYPKEHETLQELIGTVGALVSQFRPGVRVQRHFFPMRNAVMSGLCLGTVVVEASETSGALIQARQCLLQGRKLFVPQSALDHPRLRWPRKYVDRGAYVFRTVEDLLSALEQTELLPKTRALEAGASEAISFHVR